MISRNDVKRRIDEYISYYRHRDNFNTETVIGKLIKGETTDNRQFYASTPKVEFSDLSLIDNVNETDLALKKLSAGYEDLFYYVVERYVKRKKIKRIQLEMGVSKSSVVRIQNESLDMMRYFLESS